MHLTDLGHGLYYVTRTGEPFVLSGPDLPALPTMEESVLYQLLCSAKMFIDSLSWKPPALAVGRKRNPCGAGQG